MATAMAGYEVETVEAAKEGVLCSECSLVLRDAVQTPDGVRLCQECYNGIKKSANFKSERTGISILDEDGKPECYPDIAVRREVKRLQVICKNKEFGCDFIGVLEKYFKEHVETCEFKPVPCPNMDKGCAELISASNLQTHLSEECQFRDVTCQYCGQKTAQHLLESHYNECLKYPLKCSLCKQTIERENMEAHQDETCPKVKCVCGKTLCRDGEGPDSVASHLSSPAIILSHIMLSMKHTKSTMDTLLRIETRLANLESKTATAAPAVPDPTLAKEHIKLSQEVKIAIKALTDRVSPLEAIHKTMLSSNTKLNANVEVLQKALEEMDRKSKQQEAQIRALKTKLEQRAIASSWETGITNVVGDLGQGGGGGGDRVSTVEKKYQDLERQVASLKVHVSELELQLQASLASTHSGAFLWRIPEIPRRKRDGIEERVTSIYSPPFYTGRNGYKMCIRAYLNGDGMGYKTHLSLFFVLMKGEFDALLKWPFDHKVSLILVDQNHRKHIVQTFKPTTESNSFQRPVTDMNVASGCPQFAKLTALEDENYVKDDVIFIKCIIDTSKIFHP